MIQHIEINVPDGYKAIWNEETGKIDVVSISVKPTTWEEYVKGIKDRDCYYITKDSEILLGVSGADPHRDRNIIGSKEEAEAFLAMMQLRTLRKSWVGEWEPDWTERSEKYVIIQEIGKIAITTAYRVSSPMSFPYFDMANDFLECFKGLLETAKMFL